MNQAQIKAAAQLVLNKRQQEKHLKYKSKLEFYRNNPIEYLVERLGIKRESVDWSILPEYKNHKWDGTPNPFVAIANALVKYKWVGVESAVGVGKTFFGAGIVPWFLECFENSLVVTSAPKEKQLSLHIWRELGKLFNNLGRGELLNLKLRMIPGKDDWIAVGFVAGVKANEESATKAQGFHAEHMLIILEETPGIPKQIMTALQNTCTSPHNLILSFGNPDHQLDSLHEFCLMDNVEHIRISGYDHPNVVLNNAEFIPGAQSKENLLRMKAKYRDESNPLYQSRARGISPAQSIDSLIKIEWLINCSKDYADYKTKYDNKKLEGDRGLGVDVANSEFGDKGAFAHGVDNVLVKVEDFPCPNANELGHKVYRIMKDEKIKPENLGVDGVGVGAGTVNTLYEDGITDEDISLLGSARPEEIEGMEEEFVNLRSQMWWILREDLRNGELIIPEDDELWADLLTPRWSIKNGKIAVESKEDIKKRLGRSPNKGDAVIYWNWRRKDRVGTDIRMSFVK